MIGSGGTGGSGGSGGTGGVEGSGGPGGSSRSGGGIGSGGSSARGGSGGSGWNNSGGASGSGGATGRDGAADTDDAAAIDAPVTDAAVDAPQEIDAGGVVHVWLTTRDLKNKMTRQTDVTPSGSGTAGITFKDTSALQTIDGFGASFTDTSAYLIYNKLSATARAQVMSDLFSRTAGIGLSFMRVPMGASDFTQCACAFSYDDNGGQPDQALANFSTAHDDAYIIPVIKQAQSINPQMVLVASPWSPPAWMKKNNSMIGGSLNSVYNDALAQYFVKFLQEYATKGVPVWGITPQNEPDTADVYPSSSWDAASEATFIADNLAPALNAAGLTDIKILARDGSQPDPTDAQTLLMNAAAARAIHGTAWHCNRNGLSALDNVYTYTRKPVYMTECWNLSGDSSEQIQTSMKDGASAALLWNVALDQNGGPKMDGKCRGCTGLLTIDTNSGNYAYTLEYYELAQFSRFIAPGALRVASDGTGATGTISATAFRNPDGSDVVVVYNSSVEKTFTVSWRGRGNFSYTLPAFATVTFSDGPVGSGP
jgi:glucosylceramidase